jgi:hypothetical protein
MNAEKIRQLETLLERELAPDEIERLRRVRDILHIADNDALWDMLTAMEYQRAFYEALPGKRVVSRIFRTFCSRQVVSVLVLP